MSKVRIIDFPRLVNQRSNVDACCECSSKIILFGSLSDNAKTAISKMISGISIDPITGNAISRQTQGFKIV